MKQPKQPGNRLHLILSLPILGMPGELMVFRLYQIPVTQPVRPSKRAIKQ